MNNDSINTMEYISWEVHYTISHYRDVGFPMTERPNFPNSFPLLPLANTRYVK